MRLCSLSSKNGPGPDSMFLRHGPFPGLDLASGRTARRVGRGAGTATRGDAQFREKRGFSCLIGLDVLGVEAVRRAMA